MENITDLLTKQRELKQQQKECAKQLTDLQCQLRIEENKKSPHYVDINNVRTRIAYDTCGSIETYPAITCTTYVPVDAAPRIPRTDTCDVHVYIEGVGVFKSFKHTLPEKITKKFTLRADECSVTFKCDQSDSFFVTEVEHCRSEDASDDEDADVEEDDEDA
jgi:hypothetical protein